MSFLLHPSRWLLLYRKVPQAWRLGLSLLLGLGISLFLTTRVHAAQTVVLQSRDIKTVVPLAELQTFASEGEMSEDLQAFFQQIQDDPQQVRQWLTTQITPPSLSASSFIPDEFVLLQINKTLGDSLGRDNLDPLREAFGDALKGDAAFSVMDVLQQYPGQNVRLEVSRLQQVFSDVSLFVTRIEPVLKIAQDLLPELLCECNIATTSNTESANPSEAAIVYNETKQTLKSALFPTSYIRSSATSSEFSTQSSSDLSSETNTLLLASASSATANFGDREMVFEFGPLRPSISIQDLTTFAETGELSPGWRFYLNVANVNPEDLRKALNQTVKVELKTLDKLLNTLPGEFLLYEVGQLVHTPSKNANIQALRSSLILSVAPDNELSLLEVLQQYPTSGIYINGIQLARLGRHINQFQQNGGASGAVSDLEGWLVQLQASAAEELCECDAPNGTVELTSSGTPTSETFAPVTDLTVSESTIAEFLPANWQPVASHREDRGIIKVVWLQGTPYEMGYQHGQLLHDEIASLGKETLTILQFVGKGLALGRLATKRSYPDVLQECQGLSDATQDIGMTLDACMVLAYGDVYQEIFSYTLPDILFWDGCSQFVATNAATVDGHLYHGSTVDNEKPIPYIMDHPVVFVRQPNGKLPHIFVTYPGVVWPNSGMNVAGISIGLDTAHPNNASELSLDGRSNVQIMRGILETATSFENATEIMETQPRVRANLIMLTDGRSKQAGVFEFTGKSLAMRPLQENGVLYTTNHFVLEEMYDKQPLPVSESSKSRFDRYAQLMEPNGVSTLYGQFKPETMAKVLRDRVNPYTMEASPLDVFDDNASPGGNGSLRQAIYDPERLLLWVAAGQAPVPQNPFTCFSMGKMLGFPDAVDCAAPAIE